MGEPRRGGVLIRVGGSPAFVPASSVVKVAPMPKVARLAGAPAEVLGIALFEGVILPVVTLTLRPPSQRDANGAPATSAMLVCACGGEQIGLVGLEVVSTGTYPADPEPSGGVLDGDVRVPPFDVAGLYAQVQGTRWVAPRPG